MSAVTTQPSAAQPSQSAPVRHVGLAGQFPRILRSEWTKLRTVRSTVWTLLATLVVCIGLPVMVSFAIVNQPKDQVGPDFDAAGFSLFGVFLGQLIVGALGVLVISAEYSTGTIRATLTATPQRLAVLVAKVLTFAVVIAVVSFVTTFAAFFLVQAVLDTGNLGVKLGDGDSLRMVIGGAIYLIIVGLLGLGIGTIVRHSAAGISTVLALLFVLPILASFLPHSWQEHVVKYLPGQAGQAIFQRHADAVTLAPWTGLAIFAAYGLLSLVIGAVLLVRRDA
jgi:ABC-type transport system involved in multi-copper enzyme maturation permease subunit